MDNAITVNGFSTKDLHVFVTLIMLALLPACATVNTVQTESTAVANVICKSDTDIFCVESDKDRALKLNQQGIEYGVAQEYDKALDSFKKAIELDNSNPEFHYNLGVTYFSKGMPEQEEAAYMNGLAQKPGNPQHAPYFAKIHFNLACTYALQGKKDQAFEQLEMLYATADTLMYHWVESDADLASLRDDPRYTELIARQAKRESSSEKAETP